MRGGKKLEEGKQIMFIHDMLCQITLDGIKVVGQVMNDDGTTSIMMRIMKK